MSYYRRNKVDKRRMANDGRGKQKQGHGARRAFRGADRGRGLHQDSRAGRAFYAAISVCEPRGASARREARRGGGRRLHGGGAYRRSRIHAGRRPVVRDEPDLRLHRRLRGGRVVRRENIASARVQELSPASRSELCEHRGSPTFSA